MYWVYVQECDFMKFVSYYIRLKLFDGALTRDKLDLSELQRLAKSGIPEGNGRRATFWRILLNYLPLKRALWNEYLAKQRRTYQQFLGTSFHAFLSSKPLHASSSNSRRDGFRVPLRIPRRRPSSESEPFFALAIVLQGQ